MYLLKKMPASLRWIFISMAGLLVLMSVYRLFFFYSYNITNRPFTGSAFLLGLRYDARIVSAIGVAMMLLCLIPLLNPFRNSKARICWVALLSFVFVVFLFTYVADYYHYDYLQQRLSASVINFLPDAKISFGMVTETYPVFTILAIIVLLMAFFTWSQLRLIKFVNARSTRQVTGRNRKWYFVVSFLLFGVLIFGRVGQYPLRWSDAFSLGDDFKGNAALNPFQSFFSSLKFRNSTYDLKKVKEAYPLMAAYLGVPKPDINNLNFDRPYSYTDTSGVRPNVVIIICESFSAYKSSMYGNRLDATPFFNSISKEGVFFNSCFSPAFGTARGVWATLTGIPDVEMPRTASRNPAAVSQHTIMNDFTGYDKYYFLGGSTTWANIRGVLTHNINGLQIIEEDSYDAPRVDVWGISDKELFLAANKKMASERQPFISIIQTAGNHRPYTIPDADLNEFKKLTYPDDTLRQNNFASNEELNAFRYADFSMKKFIEAASKENYFKHTIFVFVGDHGLRGDAGNLFPASYSRIGYGAEHVPLLFYSPALLPAKLRTEPCSQMDILPSVAALAKQSFVNTTLGRNLFDTTLHNKEHFAFIADPDTKFIGLLSSKYYFGTNPSTGAKEFVSATGNEPVQRNAETDSIKAKMAALATGFFETSKYLLLNNKKKH